MVLHISVLSVVEPLSGANYRGGIHRSGSFHDAKCDDTALKEALPVIVGWNVAATV
jgi:hypothetical protein